MSVLVCSAQKKEMHSEHIERHQGFLLALQVLSRTIIVHNTSEGTFSEIQTVISSRTS